jgi:hypothetical protein
MQIYVSYLILLPWFLPSLMFYIIVYPIFRDEKYASIT